MCKFPKKGGSPNLKLGLPSIFIAFLSPLSPGWPCQGRSEVKWKPGRPSGGHIWTTFNPIKRAIFFGLTSNRYHLEFLITTKKSYSEYTNKISSKGNEHTKNGIGGKLKSGAKWRQSCVQKSSFFDEKNILDYL